MKPDREFQYFYNKTTDNILHKAAFRGELNKVQDLLEKSSTSLYKGTKNHELPLSLAICRGHEEIVDMLLIIYERDLKFVPNYLKDHNVILKTAFELSHSYIVAIGSEQITQVRTAFADFTCDVTQMDKEELRTKNFNVILLKATNTAVPEALFLLPESENIKKKLFNIACDLIEKNGICGINVRCDRQSKTLLHLAAKVGATDLAMRLMDLGADPYRKTSFNQTSFEMAFEHWEINTFIEMCKKLEINILNFKEAKLVFRSYAASADSLLLLIEHLANERIKQFNETRVIALTNVLSSDEIIHSYNFGNVGEKCFEKYGEYLNEAIHLRNIVSGMISFPKRNSSICVQVIQKYLKIIDTADAIENKIWNGMFHTLIRCGFTYELMEIYSNHPQCKELLFKTPHLGTYSIQSAIEFNHVELVNFLMDQHEIEMENMEDDATIWSRFLLAACNLQSDSHGKDLFMRILNHPSADPNMMFPYDGFENCLVGAVKSYNFKNVDLILSSGKVIDINSIRTSYGESLLSLATYIEPQYHKSLRSLYRHDSTETRILSDEETDDEEEIREQYTYSDGRCGGLRNKHPLDHQTESRKADEMNALFVTLIEMGANIFVENDTRGGLLHDAVLANNCVVAEKLLTLGLDINNPRIDGNRPIHFVHSSKMLNLLISKSSPDILNSRNKSGEMLIHKLVIANSFMYLFNELIHHGINVNEIDGSGNSMLHLTANAEFCEYLLRHGANPHLKNFQGETPLLLGLKCYRPAVVNVLLQQPGINLFDVTTNGTSYLQVLAEIEESYFNLIEKAFDFHRNEFLKLCEKHCNDKADDGSHILQNNYIVSDYVGAAILAQPNLIIDVRKFSLHIHRRPKIVRNLIDRGIDVNEVNIYTGTPLIAAVRYHDEELVDILIEAGADVNYKFSGSSLNGTALHVACEYGNIPLIKRLVDGGAKTDIVNEKGERPFYFLATECRGIFDRIWKN